MGDRRRLATDTPYEEDMADILHGAGVARRPPAAGVPTLWCSAGVPILSSLFKIPIPLSIVLILDVSAMIYRTCSNNFTPRPEPAN